MASPSKTTPSAKTRSAGAANPNEPAGKALSDPYEFAGAANSLYERHLVFDHVVDPAAANLRERFEAVARSVRDVLSQGWLNTDKAYAGQDPKRVYYLSMEFLIGRSLTNNITNLMVEPLVREVMEREGLDQDQ